MSRATDHTHPLGTRDNSQLPASTQPRVLIAWATCATHLYTGGICSTQPNQKENPLTLNDGTTNTPASIRNLLPNTDKFRTHNASHNLAKKLSMMIKKVGLFITD